MKKTIVLAILLFASIAFAEPVTILFTNYTSTSTEGSQKRSEAKDHTVFCNYTNVGGSTTALYIHLKGSIDNDNFETLATHTFTASEITNRSSMFHVLDKPVSSVFGQISSVTDTGTTYVGCKYKAHREPNR